VPEVCARDGGPDTAPLFGHRQRAVPGGSPSSKRVLICEYGIGGPDALVLRSPALDVSGDDYFRRLLRDRATVQAYSPVEYVNSSCIRESATS
jgi:hypothetical protein